jgi:anti-sigma B factor antagonist
MHASEFEVERRAAMNCEVVAPAGRIVLGAAARELRTLLDEMAGAGAGPVVLNMKGVPYVDSAGLGTIAAAFRQFTHNGSTLVLSNLQERVHSLVELTRLSQAIAIFDTEEDAVRSFGGA